MSAAVDTPTVDTDEVRRALSHYAGLPGQISLMFLEKVGAVPTYTAYPTTAEGLERAVTDVVRTDLADEPLGIYLRGTTVAEGVTGRGTSDDSVVWPAFRADLDLAKPGGPQTWEQLEDAYAHAKLPTPTYWQHSGGGLYPTWLLAEPVRHAPDVETLAADIEAELRRAWSEAGYNAGVDSCHDAARVWRLAGSVHRKNPARPITSTTGKFSGELLTFEQLRAQVPHRERPKGWDGQRSAPRYGYPEDFWKTYRESLRNCIDRGRDHFRHTFFLAARNGHRMVNLGLLTPEQMRDDLLKLVDAFWPGMGFNGDDRQHIHDALNNSIDRGDNAGALASPWALKPQPELTDGGGFFGLGEAPVVPSTPASLESRPEETPEEQEARERDEWEDGVQLRLRNLLMNEEARQRKEAMQREPLEVLDLDDFLDAPQPDYLFPRAIYRNGTAKVFGPPGGTKSFFVLDMALSLASGADWHGMALQPASVHYVMAEGQATNTARALAWFHHRGIPREAARGRFKAIPQGVLLTPEGIEGYLEIVRRDQPALIILDTKNRMMAGEENSGSDSAVLVRAMDALRQAAGGAAVVLVDHTGLGDTSRSRGSNAVEAAMDTELRVTRDEGGLASAEVTRDKAAEPGASWAYRIQRVEDVPGLRPGTPTPATLVPAEGVMGGGPLRLARAAWFDMDQPPVPDEIAVCTEKGAEAAKDIFRVLRFVNDPEGIERQRITEALAEGPRKHGKSTITTALALMVRQGWVDKPGAGKYALGAAYRDE